MPNQRSFFCATCYNKILKTLLEVERNGPNQASKIKETFIIFQAHKEKHLATNNEVIDMQEAQMPTATTIPSLPASTNINEVINNQ
jgi:hypothetical protein